MINYTLNLVEMINNYHTKIVENVTSNDLTSICFTFIKYFCMRDYNIKECKMIQDALEKFCLSVKDDGHINNTNAWKSINAVKEYMTSIMYTESRKDDFLRGMHYVYDNIDNPDFTNMFFRDLNPNIMLSVIHDYIKFVDYLKSDAFKYALELKIINTAEDAITDISAKNRLTKYFEIAQFLGLVNNSDKEDRGRFIKECQDLKSAITIGNYTKIEFNRVNTESTDLFGGDTNE